MDANGSVILPNIEVGHIVFVNAQSFHLDAYQVGETC